MERFRQILRKILFPGLAMVLISIPVTAALLIYILAQKHENSPIAYPSYVFSAYALVIVCARIARNAGHVKENLKASIDKIPAAQRYFTEVTFKIHVSLYVSLGINLLYTAMKLFYGVYYRSVWFGTLAVYYILLALMRFLLLHHVNRTGIGEDLVSEWKRYRLCGVILLLMNSALSGVVVLVVRKNEGFEYPGYLIYVMAMYAFYNIITAVMDVVKYRKYKSPVMSAAKVIKLAAALVSMLSLETAMLTQFENGENPADFRQVMTGITGGCVCVIVLAIAVFMIAQSTKQLKALGSGRG